MPSPYPKACASCAKSKKRCDLGTPCSRCQLRSQECRYETGQGTAALSTPAQGTLQESQPPTLDFGPDSQLLQTIEPNSLEFLDPSTQMTFDFDQDWSELMAGPDKFSTPDVLIGRHYSPDEPAPSGEIFQERVAYSLKRMKSYPSLLVRDGLTPFLQLHLYRQNVPLVIQDALCVSALYLSKNESNKRLVLATVNDKATRLVGECLLRDLTPMEQLASAQALIIYQIIRLFDGDIRLRADAEKAESCLMNLARQIQTRLQNASADASHGLKPRTAMCDAWRSWLFAESQRRTATLCYSLEGLYCFLKNGWDSSEDDFTRLSFFAQKALWTAPSELRWRTALENNRWLPVHFPTWNADMASAEPSDLDELGMMMMVLMKGVDHCSEWVGEQLQREFGLGSCEGEP